MLTPCISTAGYSKTYFTPDSYTTSGSLEGTSCENTGALDPCATFIQEGAVNDIGVTFSEDGTIDFSWTDEDSTIANVYAFELAPSAVPVPAAAWPFGSALLRLGVSEEINLCI